MFSIISLFSLASGCVSSVDPVLGSAAATEGQTATSEIALNLAPAANAAGVIDATAQTVSPSPPMLPPDAEASAGNPATEPVSGAATDPASAAAESLVAVPVPLRAPRDASLVPALPAPDAALAFAEPAATPVADATALASNAAELAQTEATAAGVAASTSNAQAPAPAADQAAVPSAASNAAPAAGKLQPVKKASLFEFLKQRQEQRDAAMKTASGQPPAAAGKQARQGTQEPARIASLEPQQNARASQGGGAASGLPGVQSGSELFGITAEEEEEDVLEPFEVASAGSMARLSPMGILTQTDKVEVGCFGPDLVSVLKRIEAHYRKPVLVTSGYRNPGANRRAGGARHSMHMQCKAADIQIEGISKWNLAKYLRSVEGRGGVGTYCRTNSVHIDTGPERDWHYPCRRAKKRA